MLCSYNIVLQRRNTEHNEATQRLPEETFHGVPRNKIPWYPTIDYEKCIRCGKCVDYCKLGVYEFQEKDGEKISVVKNPNNCVVFCTGCEAQCPAQAITHPSKLETGKTMSKLRKAKVKRSPPKKRSKMLNCEKETKKTRSVH